MAATPLLFSRPAAASADLVFGAEGAPLRPTDLVFSQPPATSGNLIFGASDATRAPALITITGTFPTLALTVKIYPPVDIALTGAFPALHLAASVRPSQPIQITGTFPPLQLIAEASYYTNTQRPTVATATTTAQVASKTQFGVAQPQSHAQPAIFGTQAHMQDARAANAGLAVPFTEANRQSIGTLSKFAEGVLYRDGFKGAMQEGDRTPRVDLHGKMQDGTKARSSLSGRMQDGLHDRRRWIWGRFQDARRSGQRSQQRGNYANPLSRAWHGPFQQGWVPRIGINLRPLPLVIPPPYWGTVLVFACPPLAYPALVFGTTQCTPVLPAAALAILPARFYMSVHNIFAQRVPDNLDVPIFDATVAADSGSYCWSLSARGPASLFDLLAPSGGLPAQLRITLDGLPFLFAIDSISRTHAFGQTGARIQGRSVTSLIAAPYLRATTRTSDTDQLAQQLASDALIYSGVSLDWGVGAGATANAGLIDWLVPAGAWSHQGTPLEAVQAIAQAAGGYLQSARNAATIMTRHPYGQRTGDNPGAPWGWMTGPADIELALDALITESVTRKDGPDINGVYVSGTSAGVLALVKRTGTAADKLAAMVTDPLITHVDAARQRGLSILGAAGSKYDVAIDLPVLTGAGQPGILDVGQLVQVNASTPWRGRVRAVSIAAKAPSLRQTITLERHLETA